MGYFTVSPSFNQWERIGITTIASAALDESQTIETAEEVEFV
jgi:hypothetical protein